MTSEQKLCYSEGTLWRNLCKAVFIPYADEVVREDPDSLIPEDITRSREYHARRVRVSEQCLASPDMFAQQHSAYTALAMVDPVVAEELSIKGAAINLWVTLSGGPSPAPIPPPQTQLKAGTYTVGTPPSPLPPPPPPAR